MPMAADVMEIRDYAAIGDGRTVALVSRHGSIDWLCWPRFDSPSLFGALLDEGGGYWRLAPTTPFRVQRRYVGDTNALETRFDTGSGTLVVTDLMPVASEQESARPMQPEHAILRAAACVRGNVEIETCVVPRPRYGRRGRLRSAGPLGIRVDVGADVLVLRATVPLEISADGEIRGRARRCIW